MDKEPILVFDSQMPELALEGLKGINGWGVLYVCSGDPRAKVGADYYASPIRRDKIETELAPYISGGTIQSAYFVPTPTRREAQKRVAKKQKLDTIIAELDGTFLIEGGEE